VTVAWILNLDADDELARCAPRDVFAALERRPALEAALASLIGDGVVLRRGERAPPGARGCAFCPTPSALAALARAGAALPAAPPAEVLRHVADRRFALALPGGVPDAVAVDGEPGAADAIASLGAAGGSWVLRRLWSFAGRGQLLGRGPRLEEPTRRFVARAIAEDGGLTVAPWLDRVADLAIHGQVEASGAFHLGDPTVNDATAAGAWVASRRAEPADLAGEDDRILRALGAAAAGALAAAGYTGPFGVDAFRFREGERTRLVRCEINPRFTMAWALGMGRPGDPG
jgi:hypothetical protein